MVRKTKDGYPIQKRLMDESGAASLIIFIDERGEVTGNELRELKGSYTRWMGLCRKAAEKKLITIEYRQTPFPRYMIKITAKGHDVADVYRMLEMQIDA